MNNELIARRLRELRDAKGVSQREVAKICNITPQALNQYENGVRIPRDEIKIRLARYYKKTVDFIFYG